MTGKYGYKAVWILYGAARRQKIFTLLLCLSMKFPCSEPLQNHSKQQVPLKIPWFSLISTNFLSFPLISETPPPPRGGVLDKRAVRHHHRNHPDASAIHLSTSLVTGVNGITVLNICPHKIFHYNFVPVQTMGGPNDNQPTGKRLPNVM